MAGTAFRKSNCGFGEYRTRHPLYSAMASDCTFELIGALALGLHPADE